MIISDLNLLVYAFNASSEQHEKAKLWWENLLNNDEFVGIPWVVYLGFLRLMSGRHILKEPYSIQEVLKICESWFSIPTVRLLEVTAETREILQQLLQKYHLSGQMISDAAIAATAIEHKAILYSNDTDFLRFPELRVFNPLEVVE